MTTTTTSRQAAAGAFSPSRRWAILGVLLAAAVLDLLDATITNIAAPTITADLGGGAVLVQWLGASYALALGVLLVVGGRLGDKYGRRRLFLIGITGFTLASACCGLAFDPLSIIVARLVQGSFGALLVPQGFGILGAVFPRDQLGKAFSAFAPGMGLAAVGGPILAGLLIDANLAGLSWRAMFLINIVLGGAAIVAALRLLPADHGDANVSIDGPGSALLGCAMFALLFGLIEGSGGGWSPLPIAAVGVGAIFLAAFSRRQMTADNPLIQPSLLRKRGFTAGLVLSIVFFAAVSGLLYVISLFLQDGLHYTPVRTAMVGMAPIAAGIVIASILASRLIAKLGRSLILAGLLITLAGTFGLLAAGYTSGTAVGALEVMPAALVIGLGMGTCFGTVYDITLGEVTAAEAGSGSGALSAVQQLANASGAAAVTTGYFHTLGSGAGSTAGHGHAMTVSLLIVAAATLASCCLVWLLPRTARPQHH
jgi:EmrB/QacA subfamily drug resistance transporter